MIAAVDTNILLDILVADERFYESSKKLLEGHAAKGAMLISPVVYAELLTQFLRTFTDAQKHLDRFLEDLGIECTDFSKEDLVVAAKAWLAHSKHKSVNCACCGKENNLFCVKCKAPIAWRNHIITDFLVGAHAQNQADVLLTRDRGFYKAHFKVKVVSS